LVLRGQLVERDVDVKIFLVGDEFEAPREEPARLNGTHQRITDERDAVPGIDRAIDYAAAGRSAIRVCSVAEINILNDGSSGLGITTGQSIGLHNAQCYEVQPQSILRYLRNVCDS